jgi:hypothetical protein
MGQAARNIDPLKQFLMEDDAVADIGCGFGAFHLPG